jgi:hypothetical protein
MASRSPLRAHHWIAIAAIAAGVYIVAEKTGLKSKIKL